MHILNKPLEKHKSNVERVFIGYSKKQACSRPGVSLLATGMSAGIGCILHETVHSKDVSHIAKPKKKEQNWIGLAIDQHDLVVFITRISNPPRGYSFSFFIALLTIISILGRQIGGAVLTAWPSLRRWTDMKTAQKFGFHFVFLVCTRGIPDLLCEAT